MYSIEQSQSLLPYPKQSGQKKTGEVASFSPAPFQKSTRRNGWFRQRLFHEKRQSASSKKPFTRIAYKRFSGGTKLYLYSMTFEGSAAMWLYYRLRNFLLIPSSSYGKEYDNSRFPTSASGRQRPSAGQRSGWLRMTRITCTGRSCTSTAGWCCTRNSPAGGRSTGSRFDAAILTVALLPLELTCCGIPGE